MCFWTDRNPIQIRDRAVRMKIVLAKFVGGTCAASEFFADKVETHLPLTACTRR